MRVILVGSAYPLRGGIAHYTALLCRTLERRGHVVNVLSFRRQYPSFLFPGRTQKDEGHEMIRVPSRPMLDSINPLTWIQAIFWMKSLKPDVVVFKYWMPFFAPCYAVLAFGARRFLKIPVVFLCDNIVPHEPTRLDARLTRLAVASPDAFIVQSASVREDLLRFRPGARFREVPHPVYDIFSPALPKTEARSRLGLEESRILLFFGYIRAYKGLRTLIEAMPEILRDERVHLVVCGEFYEGRQETVDLIHRLGLQHRISLFDEFIPNEKVADFFCAADVVVLPYVSATQSGIVQIAYNYDRPVIATAVGGLPEVVLDGKTGYLVPPQDPAALARAVLRFYAAAPDRFKTAIRTEKRKYSWDRMAGAVEELASLKSGKEVSD
jgi:glycosyltransferase involved in cell wall biosynthesis